MKARIYKHSSSLYHVEVGPFRYSTLSLWGARRVRNRMIRFIQTYHVDFVENERDSFEELQSNEYIAAELKYLEETNVGDN
jgi:hypothetical protein